MNAEALEGTMGVLAWLLVLAPIGNVYFVWHGFRTWRADPLRSPILLALLVVKVVMWLFGLAFAVFAARYLSGVPPFPLDGFSLVIIVLIVEMLPAYIHAMIRRFEREP
jgi:hypothetical protein